eukprot:scaffold3052_cov389-Prasinococcus_capsulatus_cf.AAC.7
MLSLSRGRTHLLVDWWATTASGDDLRKQAEAHRIRERIVPVARDGPVVRTSDDHLAGLPAEAHAVNGRDVQWTIAAIIDAAGINGGGATAPFCRLYRGYHHRPPKEGDLVLNIFPLDLPGVALFEPVLWVLHLTAVAETLSEQAVLVPNSVAVCGIVLRRQGVQEAARQPPQPTVAQGCVLLLAHDVFQLISQRAQCCLILILHPNSRHLR